jgi:hypothetical protein
MAAAPRASRRKRSLRPSRARPTSAQANAKHVPDLCRAIRHACFAETAARPDGGSFSSLIRLNFIKESRAVRTGGIHRCKRIRKGQT